MSSAGAIKENNNKNNINVKHIIKYEHWASLKIDVEDTLSSRGLGVLAGGRGRLHLLRVGELREQSSHKVLPALILLPPVDEHLVLSGPTETVWKHNTTQVAHSSGCSVSSVARRPQRYGEDSWNFFLKEIRWAERGSSPRIKEPMQKLLHSAVGPAGGANNSCKNILSSLLSKHNRSFFLEVNGSHDLQHHVHWCVSGGKCFYDSF